MRAFYSSLMITSAILLSGCSSLIDGAVQPVRLDTPGAYSAECTLDNGVKYKLITGQTTNIQRSHSDLVVDCYATGNRHKQIIVESTFNDWGLANVSNGVVPGAGYDHFSDGLYEYPDVITVDFVGVPTLGFELPGYHDKDTPNPYKQPIEVLGPNTPRLDEDSTYLKRGVQKRDAGNANPFSASGGGSTAPGSGVTPMPAPTTSAPAMTPSKPNLSGGNAEALTRSANPAVFNK